MIGKGLGIVAIWGFLGYCFYIATERGSNTNAPIDIFSKFMFFIIVLFAVGVTRDILDGKN